MDCFINEWKYLLISELVSEFEIRDYQQLVSFDLNELEIRQIKELENIFHIYI